MKRPTVFLMIFLYLASLLACATLAGGNSTPISLVEPTQPLATPTLAVTATATDPPSRVPTVTVVGTARPTNTPRATTAAANGVAAAPCPVSGTNLLTNPSFEGDYVKQGGAEINVAPPWIAWWLQGGSENFRPEYKPAEAALFANRVHSGAKAQQYFKSFGQYRAGLYQLVVDIEPGTRFQFSAWGQGWSCLENCGGGVSVDPANMLMRVGIDPTGGTDANGDTVVWSAYFNPIDRWELACVDTFAEATSITVFVWSSPDQPRVSQDTYWDDASLVIIP